MLKKEITTILENSRPHGWVLEPDAKRILAASHIDVPRFEVATDAPGALAAADRLGYPVAAKVVSPEIVHKSDLDGVVAGISNGGQLTAAVRRFTRLKGFNGVLVETMASGLELIIGGKIDAQFGPVVLLGMGGVGVEIYKDVALRMAPITPRDVLSMINGLTAKELLHGFRGGSAIDTAALTRLMINFSKLLLKLAPHITSIDLNPVFCAKHRCIAADARIMLADR